MKLIKLFSREYSVQYTETSLRSVGPEARNHVPALLLSQCWLSEPPNETCYADPKEWNTFLQTITTAFPPGASTEGLINRFHTYGRQYIATATTSCLGNLKNLDTPKLVERYEDYQKALILYSSYLWMGYLLNNIYTDRAKALLDTRSIAHRDAVEAVLLSPSQRTGILELQTELSRISTPELSAEQIKKILEKYGWMPCLDIHNNPWTANDVQSFFASLKKPSELMPFATAAELAGLTQKEQEWFGLVRELVFVKDMRDEYRRKGVCAILPLFDWIASQLDVTRTQLAYYTSEEIIAALQNNSPLDPNTANDRQKGFLIHWESNAVIATADTKTIESFVLRNISINDLTSKNAVKGVCASAGTATGLVRIVRGIQDLEKVRVGDIMVAVTTHPDFVPAMHRAAAVVTDEGGLTSHAAIVSRELHIPCIVGTKIATSQFHDGDRVKVDATAGVITRL